MRSSILYNEDCYKILKENIEDEKNETQTFKIIPREDQKPVLEYQSGLMGISAVPGAGKKQQPPLPQSMMGSA